VRQNSEKTNPRHTQPFLPGTTRFGAAIAKEANMIVNNPPAAALAAYANATAPKISTRSSNDAPADQSVDADLAASSDPVSLSRTSTQYSESIGNFARYFPSRSGMSADALSLAVSQPGTVSSSKGLTFAAVASDARKQLDEKYALMKESGKPYDGGETDRNSVMGDLDRRSLFAVATNEGGHFSSDEQAAANTLMRQQERLATEYYSGPEDQQKNFTDPYANDPVGRAKAALAFLESVSPEEKAAPQWLSQHQTLSDALADVGSEVASPNDKDKGHFHNLSEILAGIDTDGSESQKKADSQAGVSGYAFDQVKASLRSLQ
jgi:hypothetical protein